MISLWCLFLIIFAQTYVTFLVQTMIFDKTIQTLQINGLQKELATFSFFIYTSRLLTYVENVESFSVWIPLLKGDGLGCYATIKRGKNNNNITIDIKSTDKNNRSLNYQGSIILAEKSFTVSSFFQSSS